MYRQFRAEDERGQQYTLTAPVTMGYLDHPTVELHGNGHANIPLEAFKQLAVAYLRSAGYLIIDSSEVVEKTAQLAQQGTK